jgi:biopolymer transport protein ExbD
MAGAEMTCPLCQSTFEIPRAEPERPRRKPAAQREGPAPAPRPEAAAEAGDAVLSPVTFRSRRVQRDDDLDMTPMVDVTFLLLIFFMITAAFSLQKSLELPASDPSQPSTQATTLDEIENDPQYVIVRVDQYNTFRVVAAAWEHEQEAPTKPDLLDKLRAAQASGPVPPTHMLVMASEEALHERVVAALDAGTAIGMDDVQLITMPLED